MIFPAIRDYEPSDQGGLEAFFLAAWSSARFSFDPEGAHSDLRRIPEVYQVQDGGFWLADLSGEIVGTVAIRRLSRSVAELKRLAVLVHHRGHGFGGALLSHALSHATAAGFGVARLDTLRVPSPAFHLFEKHGFFEIARYNDNAAADLFMEKRLSRW